MSQQFDNSVLHLVKRKGFYPYKYVGDFEKFKEELPNKEKFCSLLTDRKISDKEYEHVLNVWKKSKLKVMIDFHELYLKCDALEKFRKNSFKNYGLCVSHYLSAPGLKWDAMLKMTKIKLELILDPDICTFFEKGTRGPTINI